MLSLTIINRIIIIIIIIDDVYNSFVIFSMKMYSLLM
jgi:hypothetical protein